MMKATIIGGFGFIGHKLLKRLASEKFSLTVIEKRSKVEHMSINHSDLQVLQDGDDNEQALLEAEVVIDLSYATNPMTSYNSPTSDITHNLPRAVELFELLSKNKNLKKLIVFSSGGTIYGNQANFPISENAETNPISPYGITKLAIEKYAQMFHVIGELPVIVMRPSNAYGPGQVPFRGQGFISTAVGNILKGESITLFGQGETVRDYIYVDDLVEGITQVIHRGKTAETYNIGSGMGYSNLQIIEMLREVISEDIEINYQAARSFDVKKNILSTSKINHDTGWNPETPMIEGLKKTVSWIDNYLHNNEQ